MTRAAAARRLSNWHHFIAGTAVSAAAAAMIVGTTAVGTIAVDTTATTIVVGTTAVGTIAAAIVVGTTAAATVATRACRDVIVAAASRRAEKAGVEGGL